MSRLGIEMLSIVSAIFVFCAAVTGANAASLHKEAVDYLRDQLGCHGETINPTPLLLYLAHEHFLRITSRFQGDSESCWILQRSFSANKLPIKAICAFDYTPFIFDQYPDLYVRDPGAVSSFIAVFTDAALDQTARWAKQNLLLGQSGPDILAAKDAIIPDIPLFPPAFSFRSTIACDDDFNELKAMP